MQEFTYKSLERVLAYAGAVARARGLNDDQRQALRILMWRDWHRLGGRMSLPHRVRWALNKIHRGSPGVGGLRAPTARRSVQATAQVHEGCGESDYQSIRQLVDRDLIEAILARATPHDRRIGLAVMSEGCQKHAAAALGMAKLTVRKALRRLGVIAALLR